MVYKHSKLIDRRSSRLVGVSSEPAYTRLQVDERRQQLLDAGARLFAERAYEEISMRQLAEAAGVSKPLLYHYFPSKIDLFKAAVAEKATELQQLIEPSGKGTPLDQLSRSLDAYLAWIEDNAHAWSKLMQSAANLPEARELVEGFRDQTMDLILVELTGDHQPPPALRTAIKGWLGYMDAAILDWTQARDLPRDKLRDLLVAAFEAALTAAQR
ncbi:MAG: TetR/AcrR family transcriptional regulator [Actinobacteria bacterium]|nr:MAG: TetR/AcrR family transcriptional regulator [Actinomycetota bacterium]